MTVTLINENYKGRVVSWTFSCAEDAATLEWTLECLTTAVPQLKDKCEAVFTDGKQLRMEQYLQTFLPRARHMLCVYHVIAQNVTKKCKWVQRYLDVVGKVWNISTRRTIQDCQQAIDELMRDLHTLATQEGNGETVSTLVKYLNEHVWPNKAKWCYAFRGQVFTCGRKASLSESMTHG
jgi:hypothetical protein